MAATQGLRLYNTLTRAKEEFSPIDPANVRMYVCGPTVYDYAHIGNARPAIVFDVLFRLLRHVYGPDHVTYVRNITDVDDKINARALRDFGAEIDAGRLTLNQAIRKVTETTYEQYQKDVKVLGCLEPTHQPRATEFVQPRPDGRADMTSLIQQLIERGNAYEASGEVLFDTASMPEYGRLSRRNLDEQQAGARVEVEAHKKNPGDFVLWKASSPDEPGWASPWGRGRPGWHIECSAMSAAYLGKVFDIHGGGLDLIFPHHENEIAQSRCAHGTDVMANVWMHNGFLQVEGKKMSKSDGNFVTIRELLETEKFGGRKWPGEVLRLAMLMTHYREPIDFSVRRLEEAENIHRGLYRHFGGYRVGELGLLDKPSNEVITSLCDDLNFSECLSGLQRLGKGAATSKDAAIVLGSTLGLFGLLKPNTQPEFDCGLKMLVEQVYGTSLPDDLEGLISNRLAFIASKNWAEADRIRDELLSQGIQLKDGKDPATGERVTTWEVKR